MISKLAALIEILPELKKGYEKFRCFRSRTGSGVADTTGSDLEESVDLDVLHNDRTSNHGIMPISAWPGLKVTHP